MELKFDNKLEFQLDAINSTVNLFKGQKYSGGDFGLVSHEQIISNILELNDDQILENLQEIQKFNKISNSENLKGRNFSIEMETGTGKTYVYLRTIFELYKKYGFKKFVIVVPSVAIREGTKKTLEITKQHFENIYKNIPYSFYEYNSRKILAIKQFARSNKIEILIVTLDSFNKEKNVMNTKHDRIGAKPIELLGKTNPILILDEPQNMEQPIAKKAIEGMNPLFTLRYSATHKNIYNMIYQLTPVQAYQKGLVKKIEVLSVIKANDFNNVFIQCHEIIPGSTNMNAKLCINVKLATGFKTKNINVKSGDDLFKKSKLPEYTGFIVSDIKSRKGIVEFSNGHSIKVGSEQGGNREELMKKQIQKSVSEHFDKYHLLKKHGIKVLTLFFIDKVDNYKNEHGMIRKFFVDAFNELKQDDSYFKDIEVDTVHKGYFSKKKSEKAKEEDKKAFDLIMKDKERLLSFAEPVQFIFSHSALREGWDNPNVFNICTLNQSVSEPRKRQEIGRGVRLPVNQEGDRIINGDFNILTVIANESYATYAASLQKEYVEQFGDLSKAPIIENADDKQSLKLKPNFRQNLYFSKIWEKISQKAQYNVKIDTDVFIDKCVERISNDINVKSIIIQTRRAELSLTQEAEVKTTITEASQDILDIHYKIPNIVESLENETKITRKTITEILSKINNLELIFENPKEFVDEVSKILKDEMENAKVDGIEYELTGETFDIDEFDEIPSYKDRIIMVENSIYDGIEYDSKIEMDFAEKLDSKNMKIIKMLLKLPKKWYQIPTPIGTYNPDWAIVKQNQGEEMKLIVIETKGTKIISKLRGDEQRKIHCGKKFFDIIKDVTYDVAEKPEDILEI
jgi:type III restriction enzyme